MTDTTLTVIQAVAIGQALTAIHNGWKVTILPGGDREFRIAGTLRHLSPASGSAAHFSSGFGDGDVRNAWVRITTLQGFETWIRLDELVQGLLDDEVFLGVAYSA